MPEPSDDTRPEVWVGLGSNLGNRQEWLQFGLDGLSRLGQIHRLSDVYETEPWGEPDQPAFLNAVCSLTTTFEYPAAFLAELKSLESAAGRPQVSPAWGPRTLDLDLLFWGPLVCSTDNLTIPHPLIPVRRFVLVPLCQIAPDLIPSGSGLTVKQMLEACLDHGSVRLWGKLTQAQDCSVSP